MPIVGSFRNLVVRSFTTIAVRIVLPDPGMPGQNSMCSLEFNQVWYSSQAKNHCPVPGSRLLKKSLC